MAIKGKKTGSLARKRDFIQIISDIKVPSPVGGWTSHDQQTIYNNYADLRKISQYRISQYGFESSSIAYDIFINQVELSENLADFNNDFSDDFLVSLKKIGITSATTHILYNGKKLKVHFITDDDENLGQKLRIVAYGSGL